MSQSGRRAVRHHPQHLVTESRDQRDHRRQPGEQPRRQLAPLALPADIAAFDVPADPLAHQHGHLPVPVLQHRLEDCAGSPPCARDDQRAEGSLQLAAGPGQQRMGVVARHSEGRGELVAVELGDQAELDDVPLPRIQPVDRGPHQLPEFGPLRGGPDLAGLAGHIPGLVQGGQDGPGPQPAEALVPRDRVEPGAELGRIPQVTDFGRGHEEGVLHRVGGVGRLTQHGTAVRVQRHGVPVIRLGEPGGVPGHDGRDNLGVLHAAIR